MAKKSSFGIGTLVAAAAGVVAGAVGIFLSDKDNREMVTREAKKAERMVEKDVARASRSVKKTARKASSTAKKTVKKVRRAGK